MNDAVKPAVSDEMVELFGINFWPINAASKIDAQREHIRNALSAALAAQGQAPVARTILRCPVCGSDEGSTYIGAPGPGIVRCFAVGCDAKVGGFATDEEAIAEWNRRSVAMDAAMTEAYCTATDDDSLTECFRHHIATTIGWQTFGARPGQHMQMYEEGFKAGYRRCQSDNEPELGEYEEGIKEAIKCIGWVEDYALTAPAQPVGVPAFYRTRDKNDLGRWNDWELVRAETGERLMQDVSFQNGRREIEPLYAAPQSPAQTVGVPVEQWDIDATAEDIARQLSVMRGGRHHEPTYNAAKAGAIEALKAASATLAAAPQPPAEGGWMPTRHDHEAGFCALLWDGKEIVTGCYEDGYTYGWVDSRGHPFHATHYRHLPLPPAPANGGEQ